VHDFGLKTILIDGNSSNGELTSKWAKKGVAGLKELVEGDVPPLDCLQPLDETGVEFVATSADNKTTLSKSSGWKGRLAAMMQWKQHCELIVIDLSSADAMSQATVLASKLDGIIVVAESGKTESGSAEAMFERLHSGNATIYGIVLNKMQSAVPQWFENLLGLKS
jgi:Mrp family chromosome partitioning ATPase